MHVYVYSLVIRSIRPPRRTVCNIFWVPSLHHHRARSSVAPARARFTDEASDVARWDS